MRVAIIGGGISGNVAAYYLCRDHDVTVFESNSYVGGHTNTVDVDDAGGALAIDTGFIVFNDKTYPNFQRILQELSVETRTSEMSFSVRRGQLEYNGSNIAGLFAQRRNIVRPSFLRLLAEILKFNRLAESLACKETASDLSLGDWLQSTGFSDNFQQNYLLPMAAAIWSARQDVMLEMPAKFLARFFSNHGLLQLRDRPRWMTIRGGSREYVRRLCAPFRDRIRTRTRVESVTRLPGNVLVKTAGLAPESFDAVFLACHSDQALRLLTDPTVKEQQILGAIDYQDNVAVLHTDKTLMPRNRAAWASWNHHSSRDDCDRVTLTYYMNRLQGLKSTTDYFVSLNCPESIAPRKVIRRFNYEHPVFTAGSVAAQNRKQEICGMKRTWYCGAYWRYGFHEDGVVSALDALKNFTGWSESEERNLQRAS